MIPKHARWWILIIPCSFLGLLLALTPALRTHPDLWMTIPIVLLVVALLTVAYLYCYYAAWAFLAPRMDKECKPKDGVAWVPYSIGIIFGILNVLFWAVHLYYYTMDDEKTFFGTHFNRRMMKFGLFNTLLLPLHLLLLFR